MKNTLLTLYAAILFCGAAHAQGGFTFSHSTAPYVPLTGTSSVNASNIWDDVLYTLPIGFNFMLDSAIFQELQLSTDGTLLFDNSSEQKWIDGYFADLRDRGTVTSLSPIVTTLTGTAGNRIRKFEWVNAGFFSAPGDSVNFQIWLYEADGKIETHIGPNGITDPSLAFDSNTGPGNGVAIKLFPNFKVEGPYAIGPADNPTSVLLQDEPTAYLEGAPSNGKVYTYTPTLVASPDVLPAQALAVFPNPFAASFFIACPGNSAAKVRVFDQMGRQVASQDVAGPAASIKIDLAGFPAGNYLVELTQDNQRRTRKIQKQ